MSSGVPTGTVTFFFSDVEGSTRLLEELGPSYADVLGRHHRILREAFSRCAAVELGTEGDSVFAVFPGAADAVEAAVAIQRSLAAEQWPQAVTVAIRIGLHTGEATLGETGYVGLDLHRAARIMAAAHGGQIVVSEATRAVIERSLGDGVELLDLGEHRLRDLSGRERLFQVAADGLRRDFPPLRTLEAVANNLPTQTSALVGREAELRAIRELLASADVRLVTLTGPGGIGKTRLAVQAAAAELERFRGGAYFVDLSAVRDAETALEAVVRVLGLTVPADGDLRAELAAQLRQRRLLLVLDNFEQVIPAAEDVAYLLQHAPELNVLVTSREALRVRGERLVPVEPLADSDAVSLFVARAREARPSFELTDENAAAVAEICAAVDGLPLALELAAARLALFSPDELRDRLRARLELLRGGARDLPPRQRTLRTTIDWSYDLLDDEERPVLQLVSLFSSARVAAVEDVAAALDALARVDIVQRLASLVDKSLVRSVEDASGPRLAMLGTIRDYAGEQLEAEPELRAAARAAHADYYGRLAAARHGDLSGPGREDALAELEVELGNLQAAWRFAVEQRDLVRLNSLLDGLWALHDARGWYHGAVALTNDLLDVLATAEPSPDRAEEEFTLRLSLARGLLALRGYTEEVEELYRSALALVSSSEAVPRRLPVLRSLGSFYLYRGEIDKTAAIGREVLELGEQTNDPGTQVEGHLLIGPALAFMGDGPAGLDHLERAIALFDPSRHGHVRFRLGPNPGVAARAVSGLLYWLFGYPETSQRRAADALDLARELRHPYSLAYATFHVALLDLWSGRLENAAERARDVLSIAEEHDYGIWKAVGLVLRGVTTAGLGRPEEGLELTARGVALYEHLRTPPVFWPQVLSLHAEACALAGRTPAALELLDEAAALAADGTFDSAVLKLQRGDLLLAAGEAERAEAVFAYACDEAARAGARMLQLRAATRLARLAAAGGRDDGIATLREVYETFTEGLETPDLVEARELLAGA